MANPNQSWAFEEELNRTHGAVSRRNKQLLYGCEGSLCAAYPQNSRGNGLWRWPWKKSLKYFVVQPRRCFKRRALSLQAVGLGYFSSSANWRGCHQVRGHLRAGLLNACSPGPAGRLSTEAKDVDVLSRLRS